MITSARNTDPSTSHDAARAMDRSGRARLQRQRCLRAVLAMPGRTAAEIALVTGMERHAPSRRLPELRDAGLLVNGEARICTARGLRSLTWYPASAPAHPSTHPSTQEACA